MKIAIPTEDRTHVGEHFAGSTHFMVLTAEGNKIMNKEAREKPGHKDFAGEEEHPQTDDSGRRGFGALASKRHMKRYMRLSRIVMFS